jgi:hypothetical protein
VSRSAPISRHRYDRAKAWASDPDMTDALRRFGCCARIFLVVVALLEDDKGVVHGEAVTRALARRSTVQTAMDLLTEIGVPCDDCARLP